MEKTKVCTKCGETKELSEFHAKRKRTDGTTAIKSECRACIAQRKREWRCKPGNKEKERSQGMAWRKANRERMREWQKQYRAKRRFAHALYNARGQAKLFGYSECTATIDEIESAFTGYCHACGKAEELDKLCMDHSHTTGKYRGWLCRTCNRILGLAKDSPELLEGLSAYVRA